MDLHSTLRRASSSVPILLRGCAAAVIPKTAGLLHNLSPSPASSSPSRLLRFSTAAVRRGHKHSSKQQNPNATLARVIDSEIKFAIQTEFHDCAVEVPDDFPFEIQDKPRERKIVLTRQCRDEVIKVKAMIPDNGKEYEEEDAATADDTEQKPKIPLIVTISRNGMCLKFCVIALPDKISIQSVSLTKGESSEDGNEYEGPEIWVLDAKLQEGFYKYLEVRGVGPKMANFLLENTITKDSKEYFQWLKNLKEFMM